MTEVPTTLLVGNPRTGSRTFTVAARVTDQLTAELADEDVHLARADVVDLSELGALLPVRMSRTVPLVAPVACAIGLVCRPGLLIAVSPTFKGSYTGLLKLFLDMLPVDGLAGSVAVPVMTAGWSRHRGAGDQFLRPLLLELGALAPVPCLSILEEEFAGLDRVVHTWARLYAPALGAVLTRTHRARARALTVAAGAHAPA